MAYKSKPCHTSFKKYYQQLHTRPNKLLGFVDRLLSGRSGIATSFEYQDWIVAWLVRVKETGELFLGIFGVWMPISMFADGIIMRGRTNEVHDMGNASLQRSKGETLQREANSLKAAGKYTEAASTYYAASRATHANDPWMAAELLEDCAKCYKMMGDMKGYMEKGREAAELHVQQNRILRAAVIYERIGMNGRDSDPKWAVTFLEMAKQLFMMEDDARGKGLSLEILMLKAQLGEYGVAADGFFEQAQLVYKRDSLFIYQGQRFMLFGLMCVILERGDAVRLSRTFEEMIENCPWFRESREAQWVGLLCEALNSPISPANTPEELVKLLDSGLDMMASMPTWFYAGWERLRRQIIDDVPVDIT